MITEGKVGMHEVIQVIHMIIQTYDTGAGVYNWERL